LAQFERALVLDPINGRTREIRDEETMQVSINKDQLDAAKRLRISALTPVFDGKTLKDKNTLIFDETGTGTSTYDSTTAGVTLSVTSGQYMVRRSKVFSPYFPGDSQLIDSTLVGMQIETGVTKQHGYFSCSTSAPYTANFDGIYFEADGVTDNTYKLKIDRDGTNTVSISRNSWDDKLDGTGASGLTIDFSKFNIFIIDFLWLGGFRVRFGFAFNDTVIWFHTYKHANTADKIMMLSPNQPIQTIIRSTTGSGSITPICSTVSTEGTNNEVPAIGIGSTINTGTTVISCSSVGTYYALLGMRLKTTHRDINVLIEKLNILSVTNDNFLWELRLNPTVAGTFTYSDVTNTAIQSAKGITANANTVTGGYTVASGFQQQESSITISPRNSLKLGSTIAGTMDTFVLCVSPLTTNMNIFAAIDFRNLL